MGSRWGVVCVLCLVPFACDENGGGSDGGGDEGGDGGPTLTGLLGDGLLFPFPSMHLMTPDAASPTGYRVAIPDGLLPVSDEGTPMDVERLNRRDGFSVAQPILLLLPDQEIDGDSLPGQLRLGESLNDDSPVQILDLATGERVLLMAELDASAGADSADSRTLIVRPMRALDFAHRYAVVLTTGVRLVGGGSLAAPARFAALRDGTGVPEGLEAWAAHYDGLCDALEGFGLERASLALAWDFWTASDESTHATFDAVVAATEADLPAEADFEPTFEVTRTEDAASKPDLNARVWKRVYGTYDVLSFTTEESGRFVLDDEGLPIPQGHDPAVFIADVPASARAAAPGSFGVLIYGHGLKDSPVYPLTDERDPDRVMRLADELGLVAIGTEWRGLSERDTVEIASVSVDFGKFPNVADRLHQGVANVLALTRLVQTRFRDAEWLQPEAGGGSLIDPSRIVYYGISLGGIEGATMVANAPAIRYGVFHVGAGAWTTLLERSSNWQDYDRYMREWTPDPVDRQVLYAVSQMFWDPVDPITHAQRLRDKTVLWQESMGDAQVANIATELMVRSVGAPLLQPSVEHPVGLEEASVPLPAGSSALVQFDPQCGRPAADNVPPEDNDAHSRVRRREETVLQIEAFLDRETPGTILAPCGAEACVFACDWE